MRTGFSLNTRSKFLTASAMSASSTTPDSTWAVSTTIGHAASCARKAAINLSVLVSPTIQSITKPS